MKGGPIILKEKKKKKKKKKKEKESERGLKDEKRREDAMGRRGRE